MPPFRRLRPLLAKANPAYSVRLELKDSQPKLVGLYGSFAEAQAAFEKLAGGLQLRVASYLGEPGSRRYAVLHEKGSSSSEGPVGWALLEPIDDLPYLASVSKKNPAEKPPGNGPIPFKSRKQLEVLARARAKQALGYGVRPPPSVPQGEEQEVAYQAFADAAEHALRAGLPKNPQEREEAVAQVLSLWLASEDGAQLAGFLRTSSGKRVLTTKGLEKSEIRHATRDTFNKIYNRLRRESRKSAEQAQRETGVIDEGTLRTGEVPGLVQEIPSPETAASDSQERPSRDVADVLEDLKKSPSGRIKVTLYNLHLGKNVLPGQPDALRSIVVKKLDDPRAFWFLDYDIKTRTGDDVNAAEKRSGRHYLRVPAALSNLERYHTGGRHGAGCPTCKVLARFVRVPGLNPEVVASIVDDVMLRLLNE